MPVVVRGGHRQRETRHCDSRCDGRSETPAPVAIYPYDFVETDGPAFEPCSICEKKPSFFREKWRKGMTERRVLCRRCYGAAVRWAQAAVGPLPGAIRPGAMERIAASVGRCDLCGLERAA